MFLIHQIRQFLKLNEQNMEGSLSPIHQICISWRWGECNGTYAPDLIVIIHAFYSHYTIWMLARAGPRIPSRHECAWAVFYTPAFGEPLGSDVNWLAFWILYVCSYICVCICMLNQLWWYSCLHCVNALRLCMHTFMWMPLDNKPQDVCADRIWALFGCKFGSPWCRK